ncbi:MAG: hypothetical protein M3O35_13920 [Acidobacteriota bacterium]|nr:hypothetical protein [Acidobacteriota bacterium]
MKTILTFSVSLLIFGLAPLSAQVPQMNNVDPGGGKIGSVLRVNGIHLDKDRVEEVYLSDQTLDMKVKVLEQSENWIKFRIPPSVKPGRLQLVVKTTGRKSQVLEQPVFITVEEAAQPTEIAASK